MSGSELSAAVRRPHDTHTRHAVSSDLRLTLAREPAGAVEHGVQEPGDSEDAADDGTHGDQEVREGHLLALQPCMSRAQKLPKGRALTLFCTIKGVNLSISHKQP